MKQIRESVFETNSSSMHSLVVRSAEVFYEGESIYYTDEEIEQEYKGCINKKGKYHVYKDEEWYYGRAPFRILSTFKDKFSYAYASSFYKNDSEKNQVFFDLLKKHIPRLTELQFPCAGTDDMMLNGWLNTLGITLEEFLLNKKYVVICDGDEYCIWEDLKSSGIIDAKAFHEV